MTVYHVHFSCAPDYMARRLPFRPAHLKQLGTLRDEARVVAGGPEPDGTAANIFSAWSRSRTRAADVCA